VALGTVIEMLERLRGVCQFVLMTATTSDATVGWLAKKLGAVVLDIPDDEVRALPSQRTKQRSWKWCGRQIDTDMVVQGHHGGRTIVLVYTVRRAQDLFISLEHKYRGRTGAPELLLLHSRFYPEDRARVERELDPCFGPKDLSRNNISI
jgi:CRISPR-associated endonuclease/helicase Cas3